ncbi:hypothetical protein EMCG_01326 [[Emmonsia] crescens]|uniref:Uncharacterized protein n=1 Tax=[Emmonsia] crescens TaxID=73230 RepID=A0A0G2JA44_9EURO|nr:hypothetical protein EMCG_01326 [Emmonsia crescens UAMH 3008]
MTRGQCKGTGIEEASEFIRTGMTSGCWLPNKERKGSGSLDFTILHLPLLCQDLDEMGSTPEKGD